MNAITGDIDILDIAQAPMRRLLAHPRTEDVAINKPGEAWWLAGGRWRRIAIPGLTERRLRGIAVLAGSQVRQTVGPLNPILSTDLPAGHRFQAVLPPAVPGGTVAICYRRPSDAVADMSTVAERFDTSRWNRWSNRHEARRHDAEKLLALYDAADFEGWLRAMVLSRRTMLFAGPTGAGKSFINNMASSVIPHEERLIAVEDACELVFPQPNHLHLMLCKAVSPAAQLKNSLRLRPDRIMFQELRDGDSAWVFLNEVMAGHPGSMTTIHGRNAAEAFRRLFTLIKGSDAGKGIDRDTLVEMLSTAVDAIIPVTNDARAQRRGIGEVWFADDAARRGESVADLLRGV